MQGSGINIPKDKMILKWTHNDVRHYLAKADQHYSGTFHNHSWGALPKFGWNTDRKTLEAILEYRVKHFSYPRKEYEIINWLGA